MNMMVNCVLPDDYRIGDADNRCQQLSVQTYRYFIEAGKHLQTEVRFMTYGGTF